MFHLPEELTIAKAEAFKSSLFDYMSDNDNIEIEDANVVKIDTIGCQLLLAMVTHLAAQNKTITWHCTSSLIKDSLNKLGINEPILSQYLEN
ncbi:lipid asymmetry maintenance protein MlaB [Thalassotalea euphylliae]|uniref:STAS domain-containing protein n=1 Tax=Thalassotalea euphylliae TaxID=1655234 RepID=UPI0036307DE3